MSIRGARRRCRQGLTLVEVLVASSILVMALASLSQLQSGGVRAAIVAATEARAIVICQSELDRYRAGFRSSAPTSVTPIPGNAGWSCRIQTQAAPVEGISAVTVEVYRDPIGIDSAPSASLTHWIRDRSYPVSVSAKTQTP
jgi:prepilin-type N-terminal cleavage/methylation domain-containing protein